MSATVAPVLAAVTCSPAWAVMVDGRIVATCPNETDAERIARLLDEAE
jgi:hypothetical protein